MIFKKTRKYIKLISSTNKVINKLCQECHNKAVDEILQNKQFKKCLNPNIWCEECFPHIKSLYALYDGYGEDIMEEYNNE